MVGPHFKENGVTLNSGSLEVFLPKETITTCFGGTAAELAATLGITRTEAGVTADVVKTSGTSSTGLQYISTVVGESLKISVLAVSFSDPTYNLLLHKAAVATTPNAASATQLSRTGNRTAKSLAAQAKLPMLKGSTVSMKVFTSSAKYCKAKGSTIKGLKVGTCKVTVTVKPKKGRSRSKILNLKVV
jgi:hypothetical protein